MAKFQAYSHFTAQCHNVAALMAMYAEIESGNLNRQMYPAVVVFLAFSIEAYINSVGARKIEFWDDIERLA